MQEIQLQVFKPEDDTKPLTFNEAIAYVDAVLVEALGSADRHPQWSIRNGCNESYALYVRLTQNSILTHHFFIYGLSEDQSCELSEMVRCFARLASIAA